MSRPENPLSQYYTYSYHHILLVCDSTEVAEAIQNTNTLSAFQRGSTQRNTPDNPFGKYSAIPFQGIGNYCIIINGMTDAEFVIRDAEWMSITAASCGKNGVDRFTAMALEGSLTIEEPRGIKFMNVMSYVADELQSDPSGLVFLLKTVFIGYPAPGSEFQDPTSTSVGTSYDPITNIRPVLFIIYDITGEFKVTGGVYTVSWMGINNGASKQKHIMRATQNIKVNLETPTDKTLHGALKRLEELVAIKYKAFLKETREQLQEQNLSLIGREVEYIIDTEFPYSDTAGQANSDYVVTDFKQQNTDTGESETPGVIDLGTSSSVESAIMQIVNRCQKVKEDSKSQDSKDSGEKVRYVPKVVTTVVSDSEKFKVIYKLRRMQEGRADIIERVQKRQSDSLGAQDQDIQQNTLEFDYFFTGKNTDILNFDIKMEMGLAFFQTLVSTESLTTSAESGQNTGVEQKKGPQSIPKTAGDSSSSTPVTDTPPTQPLRVREKTPIYFSTKFDDKMSKNTANPKETGDFQYLLNRHAALENLEAKVLIHGNPGLLNVTHKQPSEVADRRGKDDPRTGSETNFDAFPFWEVTPALVKLNIRMPTDDEDRDFSQPFWYEGFYYCFGITHKFDAGQFTQELDMISLPQSPTKGQESQATSTASSNANSVTNTANTANNTSPVAAATAAKTQQQEKAKQLIQAQAAQKQYIKEQVQTGKTQQEAIEELAKSRTPPIVTTPSGETVSVPKTQIPDVPKSTSIKKVTTTVDGSRVTEVSGGAVITRTRDGTTTVEAPPTEVANDVPANTGTKLKSSSYLDSFSTNQPDENLLKDEEDLLADTEDLLGDDEDLLGEDEDLLGDLNEDLLGDDEDLLGPDEDLLGSGTGDLASQVRDELGDDVDEDLLSEDDVLGFDDDDF